MIDGLGRGFNVIPAASGIHIPFRGADAVTFVTFEDDGSTIATLRESVGGASEQLLAVIEKVHKAPGVGGTWTEVTQTAGSTFDLGDDVTNDAMAFTVHSGQLSDGFDSVECTVDGGICIAIVHDLLEKRAPQKLASNV